MTVYTYGSLIIVLFEINLIIWHMALKCSDCNNMTGLFILVLTFVIVFVNAPNMALKTK